MAEILLVDDEINVRRSIANQLSRNKNYHIVQTESGREAVQLLKDKYFDLVITDLIMPSIDGIEVLKQVKTIESTIEVIVITGEGTVKTGVEAMKQGAYDYIEKPFDPEEFSLLVEKALEKTKAVKDVKYLREELKEKYKFENIVGNSEPMNKILKLISQVARTDSRVLICGENGTGKELIARAIHMNSLRCNERMSTTNLGALARDLIDSELFGHEKGAFTGALKERKGLFEDANLGTIFLDEVGDTPLQTQVRLLRVIEQGEFKRVGGNKTLNTNVRIIAATNKNLEEEIKKGNFREDLFFRLNVIPINVPPLRERKEDIPLLVDHFIHKMALEKNIEPKRISDLAMSAFLNYHWPGNVRELQNIIDRTTTLCTKNTIETEDLAISFPQGVPTFQHVGGDKPNMTLYELIKWHIISTLKKNNYNQKLTAKILGISTTTLWRKLKEYGIHISEHETVEDKKN